MKIIVDKYKCIGCGTCVSLCPECFELKANISHPKNDNCKCRSCDLQEVADSCPAGAITIESNPEAGESLKTG